MEEVKKWLLNYAKNANDPIPVASVITTKKVNAPRPLASIRLPHPLTSPQETRKIEMVFAFQPETYSLKSDRKESSSIWLSAASQ